MLFERRMDYQEFLKHKVRLADRLGFDINESEINDALKPHQKAAVKWAVAGGRRALFEAFGLGKSIQQLEVIRLVLKHQRAKNDLNNDNRPVRGLIVCPLGVKQEFARDAKEILGWARPPKFVRTNAEVTDDGIYITNYESVREGKLDPNLFDAVSLDEASCLRGFGGTKTFREFMALFAGDRKTMDERTISRGIPYRFVATATPSPNDYIELLAYSAFLDVMEVSQAKTRFFKRNSEKADQLTIHPHKEREFWLWCSSWALFLQSPADLGYDATGYDVPEMKIHFHEVSVDHTETTFNRHGQGQIFRNAAAGMIEASREKRETLDERVRKMLEILDANPDDHFLLWHDLESERHAIAKAVPEAKAVWGAQDLETREELIIGFSNGEYKYLAGKPQMLGSGCNFQRHCHKAIFLGIGYKFNDFIQAIYRLVRFLQKYSVDIHIIYAESEKLVLEALLDKWERDKHQRAEMVKIIRKYGLSGSAMEAELQRGFGVERIEVKGKTYTAVNNDCVEETRSMESDSVGLIVTSIPFSTQYEYSPNFADFGHTDNNEHFFQQMEYLTKELFRVMMPGRIAAIHVKDRVVPGGMTGLGFQTVYPFHAQCIDHYTKHGFGYMGMKTIVTDVVRENNQTYRLAYTEQCKDGTKMGVGMPEYLLLFRKPQTDTSKSYADLPVVKQKSKYGLGRWQIDAHGFTRSSGNRPLSSDDLRGIPHNIIYKMYRKHSLENVYDFQQHVELQEQLRNEKRLPVTFMLLPPQSAHPDVWTDITRMRTLNANQYAKGKQMHLCPLQFDIVERSIEQWSNEGELVLDPFGGLGTVAYCAVKTGRRGYSIELSPDYFADSVSYLEAAEQQASVPSLFDLVEVEDEELEMEAAA